MTSAAHPLFGQLLPATGFKRWQGTLQLVVVLPDGAPGTIAVAATDVLGRELAEGPSTVLSVEGVRQLRTLAATLKPARRSTSGTKTRK